MQLALPIFIFPDFVNFTKRYQFPKLSPHNIKGLSPVIRPIRTWGPPVPRWGAAGTGGGYAPLGGQGSCPPAGPAAPPEGPGGARAGEFLAWFSGFTDAEGSFSIVPNKTKQTIKFQFRIRLHQDDRPALDYIAKTLGIGSVFKDKNTVVFQVSSNTEIKNIIIPIFEAFPLRTTKAYDFAPERRYGARARKIYSSCKFEIGPARSVRELHTPRQRRGAN